MPRSNDYNYAVEFRLIHTTVTHERCTYEWPRPSVRRNTVGGFSEKSKEKGGARTRTQHLYQCHRHKSPRVLLETKRRFGALRSCGERGRAVENLTTQLNSATRVEDLEQPSWTMTWSGEECQLAGPHRRCPVLKLEG